MPRSRSSKQSRSLFVALPWDLKQRIRSQQHSNDLDSLQVKRTPAASLLPSQPALESFQPPPAAAVAAPLESKKRKRALITKPSNDPDWTCTDLVPRYTDASQVPQEIQKYWHQRRQYFREYDRLPILLDHTGWFSVTPQNIAKHIAERCQCDVIVDAFCGVGGNAIEFAKTCERVIAIDNDLTRLRIARHNALQLGVADRIEFIHGDYLDFARTCRTPIDVVFLSPPWGGVEYQSFAPQYSLSSLLPVPGDELFRLSSRLTPNIAFFLPRNVDCREVAMLANPSQEAGAETGASGSPPREWVEVEEEWIGDKLKACTAYYGGLVG